MPLTAEQRYRQAMAKSRIVAQREFRGFMEGKVPWLESGMDRDRAMIIDAIDRAYRAGLADAAKR